MFLNFAKILFVVNTSIQSPTALIAKIEPNEVNYDITKEMVKSFKLNDFNDWANIPWNSAYFDIDQPDLKLVSANFRSLNQVDNQKFSYSYKSNVAGVPYYKGNKIWNYDFSAEELDYFSRIMFNHNFISNNKENYIKFFMENVTYLPNIYCQFLFEIDKPLSFYIQSLMFYFDHSSWNTFSGTFNFSFLDYKGETKYIFRGDISSWNLYKQNSYNFVKLPIRVPNLRHLSVGFSFSGSSFLRGMSLNPFFKFGQINVFSTESISPVPAISPFSQDYERVSWYDLFGHMRNAFRWVLYSVVCSVFPVEPLRDFFAKIDGLLRRIFDDTISSVLQVDFVSGLEQVITLWIFLKSANFILG